MKTTDGRVSNNDKLNCTHMVEYDREIPYRYPKLNITEMRNKKNRKKER